MRYQLAQINIAKFRLPQDHPVNLDFVNAIDQVNAIAEAQDGFVWRLVGEGDDALDIQAYEDPDMVINMSVWRDMDALAAFVYRTPDHRNIMRRRKEWFDHIDTYMALWWVREGQFPTIEEGKKRLETLAKNGPTTEAFTFKNPFPAPDEDKQDPILDECA